MGGLKTSEPSKGSPYAQLQGGFWIADVLGGGNMGEALFQVKATPQLVSRLFNLAPMCFVKSHAIA